MTAEAMLWLQELDVAAGVKMWLQYKLLKKSYSVICQNLKSGKICKSGKSSKIGKIGKSGKSNKSGKSGKS